MSEKTDEKRTKIIFFGNGMLADYTLAVLEQHFEVIFHARTREDLERVKEMKKAYPEAHGILASYGVMIKRDVLEIFEPEGILNIHPSLLPAYRGPAPIEGAILAGDTEFAVSIMKLVPAMDAGPIYYQATLTGVELEKAAIYRALATAGAEWLVENLAHLPEPQPQDEKKATFTAKLDKAMGWLAPEKDTAAQTLRKIIAYAGFPKAKYEFFGMPCIVLAAHMAGENEKVTLALPCADGERLSIDRLQPEGRKAMDAKSFVNGYRNHR